MLSMAPLFLLISLSAFFCPKSVAISPYRFDGSKGRLDTIEFVTQPVYMNRNGCQLAKRIQMPNHFKKILFRKDLIRMARQKRQEIKLFNSQYNFFFPAKDLVSFNKNT